MVLVIKVSLNREEMFEEPSSRDFSKIFDMTWRQLVEELKWKFDELNQGNPIIIRKLNAYFEWVESKIIKGDGSYRGYIGMP
jgi:hypothetical protein